MSFTMTVDGSDRRIHFDFELAAAHWVSRVTPIAVAAIKVRAPVSKGLDPNGPKPGRLRDSIAARVETTHGVSSIVVYSSVPYAKFVVFGTRPHTIVPRSAQMLRWYAEDGVHYARYVNHPGTKPNPFAQQAIEPLTPLLIALFVEAAREAIL